MRMRNLAPTAAFVLGLLLAVPGRAAVIVCFGDSNTEGLSRSNTDSYLGAMAAYLSQIEPTTVINRGLGGETTFGGLGRIDGAIAGTGADYVIIMEGTNDVFEWTRQGMNPSQTQSYLTGMVAAVQRTGAIPILGSVVPRLDDIDPGNVLTNQLNSIIRNVASATGARFADPYQRITRRWNNGTAYIYRDTLHLNDVGYQLVAEVFAAVISGQGVGSFDLTAPVPLEITPIPDDRNVPLTTSVRVVVEEDLHPIDPTRAAMTISGSPPVELQASQSGTRSTFVFNFPAPLNFGQNVRVDFSVPDTNDPPNTLIYTWKFQTSGGNGTNGDLDSSGRIDGVDLSILASAFGAVLGDARYDQRADIDLDNRVDGDDLAFIASRFGDQV